MHAPLPDLGWWRWEIAAVALALIPAAGLVGVLIP